MGERTIAKTGHHLHVRHPRRGAARLSLLGKVALALVTVGILPLLIVSYRLVGLNRTSMTDQVLRVHAVAARTAASRVEAFVSSRYSLALAAASNPSLYQSPRSPAAQELLAGILQAPTNVIAVAVTDPDGVEFLRAQHRDAADEVTSILRRDQKENVRAYGALSASWIRIDVPLPDQRGMLRTLCDATPLADALEPEEIGDEADMVLASREGEVIIGSLENLNVFPPPLVDEARSGRVSGAKRYSVPEGERVLAAHSLVAGTPWFVLSRQPARVAEAVSQRAFQQSLVAIAAACLLGVLISTAAYKTLVRPMRELIVAQRRLAGMSETLPPGNEIEELQTSFSALAKQVRDRDAIGKLFLGRYQVMEVAGEGMMGTVYRAWDPKLERTVALKTIRFDGMSDMWDRPELIHRLRTEAITVAKFSHPHIVSVYDLEESPEATFIAMEFVEGVSLQHYLKGVGRLPFDQVIPLGAAIAAALAAAHAHGIVHHDMKPGNVLLGRDDSIKVTDFGVSQLVSKAAPGSEYVFGTPGYLPPETLVGKGYDQSGDLFALGVLMYRCLTGAAPFAAEEVNETIANTMKSDVVPPHRRETTIPEELSDLVMALLEKDRERRHSDAATIAHQLQRMAAQRELRWSFSFRKQDETDVDQQEIPHVCFLPTVAVDTPSGHSRSG